MKRNRKPTNATAGQFLRLSRIVVSMALLLLTTLMFSSTSAALAKSIDWVGNIQIMPLALASAFATLIIWVVLTLLFGRIYCSSVCPMGTIQDIFAKLPRLKRGWRNRRPYHYCEANNFLRYVSLILIAFYIMMGLDAIPRFFDPYSSYLQICDSFVRPAVEWVGGSEVILSSMIATAISLTALIAVGYCSWRNGRIICNTLCPIGSTLSLISRWSLFHFDIDTDLCTNCRRCEAVCKAQCISLNDHVVDGSRCVACFNCTAVCRDGAIRYTTRRKQLSIPMMTSVKNLTPNATISRPAKTYSRKRN